MDILVTGSSGTVGTAVVSALEDQYNITCLDRVPHPDHDTLEVDCLDESALTAALGGCDAVVHLAAYPYTDGDWDDVHTDNVLATRTLLNAVAEAEVTDVVFGSTHHVVGMYEIENSPDIYGPDYDLVLDRETPARPDSLYAITKSFGEDFARYCVENRPYPERCYTLRINAVRPPAYDHPYGDAEAGVDEGDWERGDTAYKRQVARLRSVWQSRRDCAHLVECCLEDDSVTYDIFYGVSDNENRFCDIEHAKTVLGYEPQDSAEGWDAPPE
jgi:nucleoside-diphosphate-sugar epimerase